MLDSVDDKTLLLFAMQHYDNIHCRTVEEFEEDIGHITHLVRLLNRYHRNGSLRDKLIINHIIVLSNVFGIDAAIKMLFCKVEKPLWSILKTFLIYLDYLPDVVHGVNGESIDTVKIPLDENAIKVLRSI